MTLPPISGARASILHAVAPAHRVSATTPIRSGRASRSPSAASSSPGPPAHGHSDGDVALHAVADALLGAAGLGDLGRLFPAGRADAARHRQRRPPRPRSRRASGRPASRPAGLDLTILGARPRLGDRLDDIRDRIADLLGLEADRVNVKASTGNLDGVEGAGRGISARAVADVQRLRMTIRLQTRSAARPGPSSRSRPVMSGSTAAGRPSTARPTSATSARSCSPTSSSATCATAACA